MKRKISDQRHQIDRQLQVVAEWVSLFPRCFHPGHVGSGFFLRPSPKLSQGNLGSTYFTKQSPVVTHWLKNMFHVFVIRSS